MGKETQTETANCQLLFLLCVIPDPTQYPVFWELNINSENPKWEENP